MEIKNVGKRIIIALFFLFLCQALFAQESEYFFEYQGNIPTFYQRLVWEKEDNAFSYEVLIYSLNNAEKEYARETTMENMLVVSLPPGKYRFNVTPFDLLETRGEPSEWKNFEILPAYQPEITDYSPEVFYLDRISERKLQVFGENIFSESDIYLQSAKGDLHPDEIIINDDNSAILVFDDMKLIAGSYNIFIQNPGGLYTVGGMITVGYRKPLDLFVKLEYTPLFPILFDKTGNKPAMSLAGLSFSFEAVSSKRGDINGGLELSASANYFKDGIFNINPNSEDRSIYIMFDLNIVLQKRFNRGRMAFSFHFGVGGGTEIGFGPTADETKVLLKANLGAEYMVRLYKTMYLEVGVDVSLLPANIKLVLIKPRAGLVWQF